MCFGFPKLALFPLFFKSYFFPSSIYRSVSQPPCKAIFHKSFFSASILIPCHQICWEENNHRCQNEMPSEFEKGRY